MGVLPTQRKVFFPNSDSDDHGILDSHDSASEDDVSSQPQAVRRSNGASARTLMSPAATRRKFCGHKLTLKKGRRSRHRYENERSLFSSVGIVESEEPPEGWDIPGETRSHFSELLMPDNRQLLEQFVTNKEPTQPEKNGTKKKTGEALEPEEAFLAIPFSLRTAMKKHLPLGILETVDRDICSFFMSEPEATFVSQSMSSFERLLAHACSFYNQLKSYSCDVDGIRTLKIENPFSTFKPMDPTMTTYLQTRHRSLS